MCSLWVLTHGCIYLVMLQSVYIDSLKLERSEKTSLHTKRSRREADLRQPDLPASPKDKFVSPCPNDQEYCEEANDYPTNKIKQLLKKQPKFILDHFYTEETSDAGGGDFGPFGGGAEDVVWKLCSSSETIIFPKKVKSREGSFQFVVNDDTHKQGVRVEACMSKSRGTYDECEIPGSLSLGYTSRCVQKNIQRTLVVLNPNTTDIDDFVTNNFEFPSCCFCEITLRVDADIYDTDTVLSNNTTESNYSDRE